MSTNPGMWAELIKVFSLLYENLTFSEGSRSVPWLPGIYQLCYLGIVLIRKMTLIDRWSLVWEELEINYKYLEKFL